MCGQRKSYWKDLPEVHIRGRTLLGTLAAAAQSLQAASAEPTRITRWHSVPA